MEIKVTFLADVDTKDFAEVNRALQKCGSDIIKAEFEELDNVGYFKVEKTGHEGTKVAEEISNAINTSDKGFMQDMLNFFRTDHRFLQGEEIKAMLTFMKMFSQVGTDGRNEHEVAFMKKIVDYIEKDLQYGEIESKF